MPLEITTFILGPLENNCYLLTDPQTNTAAVIDPSFDSETILQTIQERGLHLTHIWLTHAHFDHINGVETLTQATPSPVSIGLHPADLELWKQGGGSDMFGVKIIPAVTPSIMFYQGQKLTLGKSKLEVRHTPGHTRGHVVIIDWENHAVFCGDLIFKGSIGRTDLQGGNQLDLLHSIRTQILTLPSDFKLFSGHGPETRIGIEAETNPYINNFPPLVG
jgi:hydroxyacylglutathione hydrolase